MEENSGKNTNNEMTSMKKVKSISSFANEQNEESDSGQIYLNSNANSIDMRF